MKRLALMVCGEFPDIRCGRITSAMNNNGWQHDCLSRGYPPQMEDVYRRIDWNPYRVSQDYPKAIAESKAELAHVHGEMYHFWPTLSAKESGKPTILNVHDLACAREEGALDVFEAEAIDAADAHVWVSEMQRDFARQMGLNIDKPNVVIPNYVSSRFFIDKPLLPHIGGVVYEGGIAKRGDTSSDRDLSAIADALDGKLHIIPGNAAPDYGIVHDSQTEYELLIQQLARFDWGFTGHPEPCHSWLQSYPTKVFEYFAAGIPVIAMNNPLIKPFCDMGMGVYVESFKDLVRASQMDSKPFKRRVMDQRAQYTTERLMGPLVALYGQLTGR